MKDSMDYVIKRAFISGDINQFFYNKIKNISADRKDGFASYALESAKMMTTAGVNSEERARKYIVLRRHMKKLVGEIDLSVISRAISGGIPMKTENDVYFNIVKAKASLSKIKKLAYPNMSSVNPDVYEAQFDVNKWIDLVYEIQKSTSSGNMTRTAAVDYYSNFLNKEKEEDIKFKRWFKYYNDGDHERYKMASESNKIEKKSVYMSGVLGAGNYDDVGASHLAGRDFSGAVRSAEADEEKGRNFRNWKLRLHSAIRRIDKLIRSEEIDPDAYKHLSEALMNMSVKVVGLSPRTASDLAYQTANILRKNGHKAGSDVLVKIAQEVPDADPPAQTSPTPQPVPPPVPAQSEPDGPASLPDSPDSDAEIKAKELGLPGPNEVEPVGLEKITPIPGAKEGEYEGLVGEIGLTDAASKLDDVAGMLADRRIIRLLAEFDIMLDRLGIAAMFPELAESQSKLIDGYSYALTRVTKMMGQLATAKGLIDAQAGLPGAKSGDTTPQGEPSQEEASPELEPAAPDLPAGEAAPVQTEEI